jgi:hypothetical protein
MMHPTASITDTTPAIAAITIIGDFLAPGVADEEENVEEVEEVEDVEEVVDDSSVKLVLVVLSGVVLGTTFA